MKRILFLSAIILIGCAGKNDPLVNVSEMLNVKSALLETQIRQLEEMISEKKNSKLLQNQFYKTRLTYKQIESLTEFYFPGISKAMNGPAIDKADDYDDKVIEAMGFQVIEEYLFPQVDTSAHTELLKEIKILTGTAARLRQLVATNELTDANVFESQRSEILRIVSLGLSGLDSPIALQSIPEAQNALKGVYEILLLYRESVSDQKLLVEFDKSFNEAYEYLEGKTFDGLDRVEFIKNYATAICKAIYNYQKALKIPNNQWLGAIDLNKATFLENDVFQTDYFAPTHNRKLDTRAIELGKLLFFDPILSGNNQRACASCHHPDKAFSDGKSKSVAFNFEGLVTRNAPSLINSVFQKSQFWDQRVHFTEDQIKAVVNNVSEMHGHLKTAAIKLARSEEYESLFMQVFKSEHPVSDINIQTALSAYVRSLHALNSKFDRYMRGESFELTGQEMGGFNLFMGKGKCGTCHFFPLFNGTVPPSYSETESEILGVPSRADTINASLDSDLGKYHVFGRVLHQHAFKTPTVRNAALTGPYMHNGVFSSLEEVVDFYDRGGGAGIGIEVDNQTLPADRLNLSERDKLDIIAFIHSLTDTIGMTKAPSRLPAFKDAKLDSRKIGGVY